MGHHEVRLNFLRRHQIDRPLRTGVLPPDIDDGDLLATNFVDRKGNSILARNPDQHEFSAGLERVDGLIDRLLLTGALERHVHSQWLPLENPGHHIFFERVANPRGAPLAGYFHPFFDLLRQGTRPHTLGLGANHATEPDRAGSENRHIRRRGQMGLFDRIGPDRQRLAQDTLLDGDFAADREATLLRHDDELAQAAITLARRAEESQVEAGILASLTALIAVVARHSRLDHDLVAHLDAFDGLAHCRDAGGAFVAYNEREFDHLRADPPGFEVVYVRSTDAYLLDLQQNVGILLDPGVGNLAHLHPPNSRQYSRFHKITDLL